MTYRKAIANANNLRPNALRNDQKYAWIAELEGKLSDHLGLDIPENPFPEDGELLMPFPYDNIYEMYLVSMIDYYAQETGLYANDSQMFNAKWDEALSWWERNNRPKENPNWRVM